MSATCAGCGAPGAIYWDDGQDLCRACYEAKKKPPTDREAEWEAEPRRGTSGDEADGLRTSVAGEVTAPTAGPPLAREGQLLDKVVSEVHRLGVHGEDDVIRLVYLATTSRLLPNIVNVVVKGPSSGGKSFVTKKTLELFPASAYHALTGMSERALAYDDTPVAHRMIVIYEAAGFGSEMASYLIRSLLSEGRLSYQTVVKEGGRNVGMTLSREGPTGLITTTTAVHLHPENETRLISITVADDRDQTKAVMRAAASEEAPPLPDPAWHLLQEWLGQVVEKSAAPAKGAPIVTVPFAATLSELIPPIAVRLRRDFSSLRNLIAAHALLHAGTRTVNEKGSIVATIDDYEVVRAVMAPLVADAIEATVSSAVRETVEAVRTLTAAGASMTCSNGQVAGHLHLDKSSTSRRLAQAEEAGYVVNEQTRPGREAKWCLGSNPLPADVVILPTVEDLQRALGAGVAVLQASREEAREDGPEDGGEGSHDEEKAIGAPPPPILTTTLQRS